MTAENNNGMQCNEFDALLSEALDEKLTGQRLGSFQAHARSCPNCGPLLTEADAGQRWLKQLGEAEPPVNLVRNILVATTGLDTGRLQGVGFDLAASAELSWFDRVRDWAGTLAAPIVAIAKQPRFAMSFGMAFFTLSVSLSLAGVKLGDLKRADLRPSNIRRTYYSTSGRVVKYYENIRFVYEIESRVREFKRATTPAEPAPEKKDKGSKNDNTSGQPERRQDRNYSQEGPQLVLASLTDNQPVVILATHRRFS